MIYQYNFINDRIWKLCQHHLLNSYGTEEQIFSNSRIPLQNQLTQILLPFKGSASLLHPAWQSLLLLLICQIMLYRNILREQNTLYNLKSEHSTGQQLLHMFRSNTIKKKTTELLPVTAHQIMNETCRVIK